MKLLPLSWFPAVNASLNAACSVFSAVTRLRLHSKRQNPIASHFHDHCFLLLDGIPGLLPLASTVTSTFYVHGGAIRFGGHGWIRTVYFALLLSHTILAVVIVPLVLITLTRGLRERFAQHRAIARWTLPLWLYVSVTGVIVYWLLYIVTTPIWPT